MEYHTSIGIEAFADDIWKILTDADGWTEWNTTIDDLIGVLELDNKLDVYSRISPERAFRIKVTALDRPHRMVWRGGLPFGLFRGIRTFTLSQGEGAFTEFTMHEQFSGLLTPLFKKIMPDLQPSFDEFAICLKKEAES